MWLSSGAITEALSKRYHRPSDVLEALSLPLTGSVYRSCYLQSLRKIGLNSKPQQGMALLSKLRPCQSTCSYYIKQHAARQRAWVVPVQPPETLLPMVSGHSMCVWLLLLMLMPKGEVEGVNSQVCSRKEAKRKNKKVGVRWYFNKLPSVAVP